MKLLRATVFLTTYELKKDLFENCAVLKYLSHLIFIHKNIFHENHKGQNHWWILYIKQHRKYTSSRPEVFCKKGVPRNFAKLTGKYLCQSLFFKRETLTHVFCCEFCEISKTHFYIEPLWWLLLKVLVLTFSFPFFKYQNEASGNTLTARDKM